MKAKANGQHHRIELGRHIVADPGICGGQPTFKGTRIMVWIVLDQLGREMPWDTIVKEWGGSVPREAIAEAIELARENLVASNERWRRRALTRLAATG